MLANVAIGKFTKNAPSMQNLTRFFSNSSLKVLQPESQTTLRCIEQWEIVREAGDILLFCSLNALTFMI